MKIELRETRYHYWRISVDGKSAGKVFINEIDEAPYGFHHSIQIFLNKAHQGRGIGNKAYARAVKLSRLDTVYAHMAKSNLASRRAAEKAGFVADDTPQRQLTMIWRRQG